MIDDDYRLTSAEKAAKRKEKIKAQKFSDAELDEEPTTTESKPPKSPPKGLPRADMSKLPREIRRNGKIYVCKTNGSPAYITNGIGSKKIPLKKQTTNNNDCLEFPEDVIIEDQCSTVNKMNMSDLIAQCSATTSIPSSATTSLMFSRTEHHARSSRLNERFITFSQPNMHHGVTSLTQSTGITMTTPLMNRREGMVMIPRAHYLPVGASHYTDSCYENSAFDLSRLSTKEFMFELVENRGPYVRTFLYYLLKGDFAGLKSHFELGFAYVKSLPSSNQIPTQKLRQKFMQNMLRIFINEDIEVNIFMLLACGFSRDGKERVKGCNEVTPEHGCCDTLNYLFTFFDAATIKVLLNIKSDISNRTPFAFAAVIGSICQMRALLEKGACPNVNDVLGYSPAHYAAIRGSVYLFNFLAFAGADLGVQVPYEREQSAYNQRAAKIAKNEEVKTYITTRMEALKKIFHDRLNVSLAIEDKEVAAEISELHFSNAFTPGLDTHKIDIDFEIDYDVKLEFSHVNDEMIIVIYPFEYLQGHLSSLAGTPEISFVQLKERVSKGKIKTVLHDVIEKVPWLFKANVTYGVEGECEPARSNRISNGLYFFKLPEKMREKGCVPIRLNILTRRNDKNRDKFEKLLFAMQAYILRPKCKPKETAEKNEGKKGKKKNQTADTKGGVKLDPNMSYHRLQHEMKKSKVD